MPLPNNSIVATADIGAGPAALVCTTTYITCCTSANPRTQWYFPNGTQVPNNPALPYRRTRGRNPGSVYLNRNSESTTIGFFHCDIPDGNGVLQSLYVGIYTCGTGEFCTLHKWTGICIVLPLNCNANFTNTSGMVQCMPNEIYLIVFICGIHES